MRKAATTLGPQARFALEAFLVHSSGAGIDCAAAGHLLQHFFERRLPLQGKQLHARLVLSSVVPDNFLASKLINFYSKAARDPAAARRVFDQIPQPNTFSYNALLLAYALAGRHVDALRLFSSLALGEPPGSGPDGYSVTCLLKAVSGCGVCDRRLAKEVHCYVLRGGFDADVVVGNALISFYSRCDDVVSARNVFDEMSNRDLVCWNSMISGYSQGGFYEECKALFREMVGFSGFRPDGVTVASVSQACGQSKDLVFGREVHKFVVNNQLEMDILVCNALVGVYAKCGCFDYVRELFEEMSDRDEVTYNTIISGYMEHGFVDNALDVFGGMISRGLSSWNAVISGLLQNNRHDAGLAVFRDMQVYGFRPNSITVASILPAMSHYATLKGGKEMHAYALKSNCFRNVYVATGIIDTYAKSGFLSGARSVFDLSKCRSLIIWTSIISAYSVHGDAHLALKLFDEMIRTGVQPDAVTLVAVLASCAHCGLVDEAWEIFNSMSSKYGIQPSMEHYACMVGTLSRGGKLSVAKDFVSRMPIEPNAKVWGALFHGAMISGDVELGEIVFNHLVKIEPEGTVNYVTMANLYSEAGRWKDADKIREMMNSIGWQKVPGRSWTEKRKVGQVIT